MSEKLYSVGLRLLPGVFLCVVVAVLGFIIQSVEEYYLGRAWLESLVLAILIGVLIRSTVVLPKRFHDGIGFSAKMLLEIAVMLLGAGISLGAVAEAGFGLFCAIALTVFLSILFSYSIGRLLKLPKRLAILVACGNSICGNSAIAAAAPVIGAKADEVTSSIAFTAVLGVVVVVLLPSLVPLLGLSFHQYGVLAGLTVYAVPQVLAATAPVSLISQQTGTLVKLVRVLMLGPVIFILSLIFARQGSNTMRFSKMVPWFIIGFLVMMLLRSLGLIPVFALPIIAKTTSFLTILSMAALGLGVDIRTLAQAGGRVTLTGFLSLLVLGLISLALIRFLGVQ